MTRAALSKSVVAMAVLGVVATACSASPGKFSKAAADYIESDDVASWAEQQRFSNAACTDPADTKIDTTFQCTADATDGHSYVFQVVITGERKFRVEAVQPQN